MEKAGRRLLITFILVYLVFGVRGLEAKAAASDDVLAYMNAVRIEAGLPVLVLDETLQAAASTRAAECATKFSHIRPNGKAWCTVSSSTNGENLAHASNDNQSKAENVVYAWLLSPKHKANVMRSTFSSVGIAYYSDGNGNTYIACEFK